MDEGVVFELLHPLQIAILTEGFLQDLLGDAVGQVPHKQHFDLQGPQLQVRSRLLVPACNRHDQADSDTHLGHDLWIGVFHGVGPLYGHHVAPDFDLPAHQPAASLSGCFVVFILQEAEASVLALVLRLKVEDDVTEALWKERQSRLVGQNQIDQCSPQTKLFTCDFRKLLDNLLLCFTLRDGANK